MAKKRNLTDHQVAYAAYHTLKDEGLLPPLSSEEIAALEDEFGTYPKAKMTAADALKIAKGTTPVPKVVTASPFAELKGQIKAELGLAARKGGEIPAEVWAKMEAHRKKAQDEQSERGK